MSDDHHPAICTCEPMNGAFEIRDYDCPRHGEVIDYVDQVPRHLIGITDGKPDPINDTVLEYRRRITHVIDTFPYASTSVGPVDDDEEDYLGRVTAWAEGAAESLLAVQDTVREMQVELEQHRADRRALRRVFGLGR